MKLRNLLSIIRGRGPYSFFVDAHMICTNYRFFLHMTVDVLLNPLNIEYKQLSNVL
jgi:hypothetical protein